MKMVGGVWVVVVALVLALTQAEINPPEKVKVLTKTCEDGGGCGQKHNKDIDGGGFDKQGNSGEASITTTSPPATTTTTTTTPTTTTSPTTTTTTTVIPSTPSSTTPPPPPTTTIMVQPTAEKTTASPTDSHPQSTTTVTTTTTTSPTTTTTTTTATSPPTTTTTPAPTTTTTTAYPITSTVAVALSSPSPSNLTSAGHPSTHHYHMPVGSEDDISIIASSPAWRTSDTAHITNGISVFFVGGVGNIMFQYAALLGTAASLGKVPYLESSARSTYLLNFFNMSRAQLSSSDDATAAAVRMFSDEQHEQFLSGAYRYREASWGAYESRVTRIGSQGMNRHQNVYLAGFFQSWRYFHHIRARVRRDFTLLPEHTRQAATLIETIRREAHDFGGPGMENVTLVGVHIRRGEYVGRAGWAVPDVSYFVKAIRWFEERRHNVVFVLCSDDVDWCKHRLVPETGRNVYLVEHTSHMLDLAVLTRCDHHIVSVGSFGWWAAWLAGGDVVYYRDWVGEQLAPYYKQSDYFPPAWLPMTD